MSNRQPAAGAAPSKAGFRVGDLVAGVGGLLALVSTFLPYESNDYGHLTVWHSDFLSSLFAVIVSIAAAVVGTVFASRPTPLVPKLGLTAGALAALASAAAVLFYAAGLLTFSQDYLATAGPTLGAVGIVVVAVGSFGLALAAPGAGFAKKLGGSGTPKTVQPQFGQFAPGGPGLGQSPDYGYRQGFSRQPPESSPHARAPEPIPDNPSVGSAPPDPVELAQVDSAQAPASFGAATAPSDAGSGAPVEPAEPVASDDTIAGLVTPLDPVKPAQAATFSPYWVGVTAPLPAFSPAAATSKIGEVTPGQWYLVTGQHPAGLLIDLRGRPVLVRDVNALIRG